jgi:PHP-associated
MPGAAGNPFGGGGVWLRCALHAHTTESDGDLPPRALAAAYAAAGYDVLAVTDHWRLTRVPPSGSLLTVPASELSCDLGPEGAVADVLVYGLREIPDDPGGDRRNWIVNEEEHWEQRTFPDLDATGRFAREQGAAAYVAHPYWTGLDGPSLIGSETVHGLEVYNAGCEHESGRGDSSALWDAALEAGRSLHCIAADDAHVAATDIGHASTWVRVEERSPEAVVEALRSGRSYASTGPRLHELRWAGTTVEVACTPCRLLALQMEREKGCALLARDGEQPYGRVLERDGDGLITRAELRSPWPDAAYARLRAVDSAGRSAWTNPL